MTENSHRPIVPAWRIPVDQFTDTEMIHFAATRHRVELDDRRTATLVRWITPRRTSQARVQFYNGNFLTVHKRRIVTVFVETKKEQTNDQ